MRVFSSHAELEAAVGEELGVTGWLLVDQRRVDLFAEATGDHQWIHVDPDRAARSPFGGTIAHGYLSLSLLPMLASQLFRIETGGARLNYGVNRVRFPRPLPVGSRVRCRATIVAVTGTPAGQQVVTRYVLELEGEERPAMVAETVVLLLP